MTMLYSTRTTTNADLSTNKLLWKIHDKLTTWKDVLQYYSETYVEISGKWSQISHVTAFWGDGSHTVWSPAIFQIWSGIHLSNDLPAAGLMQLTVFFHSQITHSVSFRQG